MRYSVFRPVALALCLLFALPGQAADGLLSLYQEAMTSNAAFLAARAGAAADRENEAVARGQLFPSLSISGGYGRNEAQRKVGSLAPENFNYDNYSYNLGLRQPLFRKYNFALYAQAKAQGEVADARLSQAEAELIVRLVSAYMDVLFADEQSRLIGIQKTSLSAQLAAAEKALLAGSGTRIDIDEARARYDMVLAQEIEVNNLRAHNRRTLGAIVNREIEEVQRLDIARFQPAPPLPADALAWVAEAEAGNPEYQGLLAQRRVAEQEVEKALAGHYPTVDLVANTGSSGNDSISSLNNVGDTKYRTSSYGLQLNIPLFAGGQVNATVRQARAKLEQVLQQSEDSRRNIGVQTRREFDNVVQGLSKIRALERAELSGRQTVLSARKGVEAGVRSTLDVLQVEQQYYTVLRDLAQARFNYLIAGVKLKALAGVLSPADIEGVAAQFAP